MPDELYNQIFNKIEPLLLNYAFGEHNEHSILTLLLYDDTKFIVEKVKDGVINSGIVNSKKGIIVKKFFDFSKDNLDDVMGFIIDNYNKPSFGELVDEGKTFKEINKIYKRGEYNGKKE